jgi:phosphonate degradation associated HDIG domain protein
MNMGLRSPRLTRWLETAPASAFTAYAMTAGFATYFCMYAFRKPFAAAKFTDLKFLGTAINPEAVALLSSSRSSYLRLLGLLLGLGQSLDLKTAFVISQILGYTLSKYLGIKVCSEAPGPQRARLLVLLILTAEAALLLFAVVPPDLKIVAIFFNGLPLGMVWGLVVWYLEGRRTSELLLAGLSCSFIVSSGAVKDVGRFLLTGPHVSEAWMPFLTGLVFLPGFLVSVWLLDQLPPPNSADRAARSSRTPMDGEHRRAFVGRFLLGLVLLLIVYLFLTAYRDFRDNYAVEILDKLGYGGDATVLTRTELLVAFGVMASLAGLNLIRDNRRGLVGAFAVMIVGMLLLGAATLLLDLGRVSGFWWLMLIGLGSYLAYVPYNSVLFDRMLAATRATGTAVFAIYLADALGYSGSVAVQLYRDLAHSDMSRLTFFRLYSYILSGGGAILLIAGCVYFYRKAPAASLRNEPMTTDPSGAHGNPRAAAVATQIIQLFQERGDAAYLGEPVSQTEHALQAAWAAEKAGADSSLIAAALLHDLGHLLHDLPEDCAQAGIDDRHEDRGARWLAQHFGSEVTEPIRLHVPAKRYLCATETGYFERLSEASVVSLRLQGGPFTPQEVEQFQQNPFAQAAVALRHWDEAAKVAKLETPGLEHFRPHLLRSVRS